MNTNFTNFGEGELAFGMSRGCTHTDDNENTYGEPLPL